ncbi:MAG: hypothetical protein AB8B69_08205 [Chitinophagales bacterium]
MQRPRDFFIDQLKNLVPTLSSAQCDYYAEACIIALENQKHSSNVELRVIGDFGDCFVLKWTTTPNKRGWTEPRIIAENGGIAIAFLLIIEMTDFQVIQQSIIGTGFDYWLGYKENHPNYDPDNFLNARLEISGINKGSRGELNRRVKQKLQQVGVTDYLQIPAYIIVTEFSNPISKIIKK